MALSCEFLLPVTAPSQPCAVVRTFVVVGFPVCLTALSAAAVLLLLLLLLLLPPCASCLSGGVVTPQNGKGGSDVVICGNKCDLQGREVAREEGAQLAAELGVPYIETSAKDNLNVEEAFMNVALRVSEEMHGHGWDDTEAVAVWDGIKWDGKRWLKMECMG